MSDYSRLLELLKQLVRFETIAGNTAQVDACYGYIEERFRGLNVHADRYESNGFESLIITTQATRHPKVLLQAHIDVVPGYRRQYRVQQKDGVLYGRGVYDMKFAAACFLHLIEELAPELSKYDIGLLFTSDEEVDGVNGVKYILDQGYGAEVCILPDSGEDWGVEASAKGFAIAEITARGTSAHGSRPWEADNAAVRLMQFLSEMEPVMSYSDRLATTCTLTRLDAGPAYNQIPGEATATFDIRFPDDQGMAAIQQKIQRVCTRSGLDVKFTELAPAIQHNVSSPYVETWQACTEAITGREPGYTHSFAASDARYLVPRGITTISSRPKGGGHHGPAEWISEKEYYQYYDVLKQFVLSAAVVDN